MFDLWVRKEATHSNILAWRIPGPGGLQSIVLQRVDTTELLTRMSNQILYGKKIYLHGSFLIDWIEYLKKIRVKSRQFS